MLCTYIPIKIFSTPTFRLNMEEASEIVPKLHRRRRRKRKNTKRYYEHTETEVITLDESDENVQIKEETKSESEMDVEGIPTISTQETPVKRYLETVNEDLTQGD